MLDDYNRNIDYLRISVTDRCDLRCRYCMPEDGVEAVAHEDILSYSEIVRLCRIFASLGISKIKLTGGEPLCRKNVAELIAELKKIKGINSVTITTNGILLAEQLDALMKAGLDAVNISLDTLNRDLYREMTRRDMLKKALSGLNAAMARGDELNVKVNCVTADSRQDFCDVASLAEDNDICVRFIEMMPIGFGKTYAGCQIESVKKIITDRFGELTPTAKHYGNGPAVYYTLENFKGRIGFISAVSHKFCSTCNRIRLTSQGFLKTCLQYDFGTDLKNLLRGGAVDDEIASAIKSAVSCKPREHHFGDKTTGDDENKLMSQIGG